jgi:hypothetical protein
LLQFETQQQQQQLTTMFKKCVPQQFNKNLPFFRENNVHTFFSSSRYIILPKNFFSDFAQDLLKSHYFEQNLILGTKKSEKKRKLKKKTG